jgi:cholesterol transport system auxiliary component
LPKLPVQPTFYSLDRAALDAPATLPPANGVALLPETAPTLVINPPRAAAGFDSQRIIYTRESHQLEYFSHSEWIDTPARMLAPLIVAALSKAGAFRAVVPTPSLAAGDIKLDTEIVRLQQVFGNGPSRVQFTLRAYLVDSATRRVLAWREFDETVAASSEDPRGGVDAANRAVQNVLRALTGLCIEAASTWQSFAAERPARKL